MGNRTSPRVNAFASAAAQLAKIDVSENETAQTTMPKPIEKVKDVPKEIISGDEKDNIPEKATIESEPIKITTSSKPTQKKEKKTAEKTVTKPKKTTDGVKNKGGRPRSEERSGILKRYTAKFFSQEDFDYLKYAPGQHSLNGERVNERDYFKRLIKENYELVESGKIKHTDPLIATARDAKLESKDKGIDLPLEYHTMIYQAASRLRLTPRNYIAYVINKARIEDKNYY